MRTFIQNAKNKSMVCVINVRGKAIEKLDMAKKALYNTKGQGTLDVAVTVLISIVLGALILAGLYLVVNGTVLPTITQKVKDMFNYKG